MSAQDTLVIPDPSGLVLPSDAYTAISVQQTQDIDQAGNEYDVADIYFTVTGRPGIFSVQIPLVGFRIFENGIDLSSEARIVDQLFDL